MKVAKTKKELAKIIKVLQVELESKNNEFFVEFPDNKKGIKAELVDEKYGPWVNWPTLKEGFNKKERRDYEIFICGYLFYFEQNVGGERTVYFDWKKGRESKGLTIWLKPFYGTNQENSNSEPSIENDLSKYEVSDVRIQKSPIAPPPALSQAPQDPPQVPPPPPPPRNYP